MKNALDSSPQLHNKQSKWMVFLVSLSGLGDQIATLENNNKSFFYRATNRIFFYPDRQKRHWLFWKNFQNCCVVKWWLSYHDRKMKTCLHGAISLTFHLFILHWHDSISIQGRTFVVETLSCPCRIIKVQSETSYLCVGMSLQVLDTTICTKWQRVYGWVVVISLQT